MRVWLRPWVQISQYDMTEQFETTIVMETKDPGDSHIIGRNLFHYCQ